MNRLQLKGRLGGYQERLRIAEINGVFHVDCSDVNVFRLKLLAASTIKLPLSSSDVESIVLVIEPNTFAVTWGGGTIEWLTSDGNAPTLVTTANFVNVITFIWDGVDNRWLGFFGGKES